MSPFTEAEEVYAAHWLALPKGYTTSAEWQARERVLFVNPTWRARSALANDLRNGDPFDVPMDAALGAKRRYQWAENSWRAGYLSAAAFLNEARLFDAKCASFRAHGFRLDRALDTPEQIARERVRLRKEGRLQFVDQVSWGRVAAAIGTYREKEIAWQLVRTRRRETAEQRHHLMRGRRTLAAIRQMLRGAVPSQRPA